MTYKTPNTPFSTRISGGAKETRLRLRSIFQWKKKRPPVIFFLLAALIALSCGSLVGFRMAARPETVFPQIAMAVQYYDAYENYIEIPVLVMPGGQEENDGVSAINSVLAGLTGEYQAILDGAVGAEIYGLDGVGNHCLFYPAVTDRYINLLFFRESEVTDLNTGHVLSLVYDKEEKRQMSVEDALTVAGLTEQELYDALSAQCDSMLEQVFPDAHIIIRDQALEGFRMDGNGDPVFYLTARLDDADDLAQDHVSGGENVYIWSHGVFTVYDQYTVTGKKPLVPDGETMKLNPPLWCQWYFESGTPSSDSAVYVSFEAESAYPGALTGYLPVSYVKDGEQQLTGSFWGYDAIADAVADMPAADSLARIGAVATNGMWDLFPVEVNHKTYTMETQPAQEDWYRYFEEKLADLDAADTPVIITEAWVFVWDGVKTAVVNAGNVLLSGDDTVRRGAAHIPLNPPVGENAIMYQMSVLFREGNEPIDLIYAETAQVSYRPPQDEAWQHIFSAVQYDARGSLTVCPVFTDFTGELVTRGFRYSPAQYVVCNVDGDGVVELLQGCDGSSSLTSRYSVYKLNGGTPEVVFSLAG